MSCKKFQQYELGEIEEHVFQDHLKTCKECKAHMKADTQLMNLAKSLKQPVHAPKLWDQIENQLKAEQTKQQIIEQKANWPYWNVLRIAAVIALIVGVSVIIKVQQQQMDSGLIAKSVLKKVEKQEIEYMKAIADLEKASKPQLAQMNLELQFLYRDRLETINQQIALCKKAIETNPANAHIRKYLMMALKDKKETLTEILQMNISNG